MNETKTREKSAKEKPIARRAEKQHVRGRG